MNDTDQGAGKSPAFQFYPKDFLSDEEQAAMSVAEAGIYIRLLCRAWDNGSIPDDHKTLAKLSGATAAEIRKCWPAVSVKFNPHPSESGRLINPRMERERTKQAEYRRRQAETARKGWQSRGNGEPMATHAPATVVASERQASGNALHLLSSSASASADSSQHVRAGGRDDGAKKTNGAKPAFVVPSKPSDDSDLSERAGRFCERYAELHEKFRHGAKLVKAPAFRSALGGGNMDYQEALTLVSTWDDERLDKLAEAFLKVQGDDWIDSGPRTLARFRSRASWCEDMLLSKGVKL